MSEVTNVDFAETASPVSVEAAFRRVRWLAGALILVRLWSTGALPHLEGVLLVAAFWSVNFVAVLAERRRARERVLLDVVQLLADTAVVLLVALAQHNHTSTESADWAVLVLPAIEGAIRFGMGGAIAGWLVLAGGYYAVNTASTPNLPAATIAQRLTVVLLVTLPVGYLADHLVDEIAAHRRGRDRAERRSALLHAAALGGRRTSRLDVDDVIEVICTTAIDMGFSDPDVFELLGPMGRDPANVAGRAVRGSHSALQFEPDDPRLLAAASVRAGGAATVWPPESGDPASPRLFALPIPMIDHQFVVLTSRWDGDGTDVGAPPSAAQVEVLELFAAQAGASLHNAQVHQGLEELKDRLDHEASHDSLTNLANRRRFTDELQRVTRRGRPGDLIGVLFLDLDGFKVVNDRYGHEVGNDLLIAVASRLRSCVRPGDLVARLGGDEFTIMLTRLENVAPAASIATRICELLSEPFFIGPREIRISTSVGIAFAPSPNADTTDLLRRADAAMYQSKSEGKARWTMDPASLETAGETGPES
jgi:diguanylate cyclase (GGDEF)-like protein